MTIRADGGVEENSRRREKPHFKQRRSKGEGTSTGRGTISLTDTLIR